MDQFREKLEEYGLKAVYQNRFYDVVEDFHNLIQEIEQEGYEHIDLYEISNHWVTITPENVELFKKKMGFPKQYEQLPDVLFGLITLRCTTDDYLEFAWESDETLIWDVLMRDVEKRSDHYASQYKEFKVERIFHFEQAAMKLIEQLIEEFNVMVIEGEIENQLPELWNQLNAVLKKMVEQMKTSQTEGVEME